MTEIASTTTVGAFLTRPRQTPPLAPGRNPPRAPPTASNATEGENEPAPLAGAKPTASHKAKKSRKHGL
jgi:hypothetical protein